MSDGSGPSVVDLFCGAGGLSEGLRQAGFCPRVGIDFDKHAAATYRHNHPGVPVIEKDISTVTGAEILELSRADRIDLVAGGPSCQGFSTHGKRMQDDPRNFLFKHFVRLVDELRPRMFLMENVRGMLTYNKGAFRRQIEAAFEEIGYRSNFAQVVAADYGVPQLRHRILFMGTCDDNIPLTFPQPTHGESAEGLRPYVTVEQAIGDLPSIGKDYTRESRPYHTPPQGPYQVYCRSGAPTEVSMHVGRPLSAQASKLAKFIGQGEGLRAVPVNHLPDRFKRMRRISNGELRRDCTTLYHRLSTERPSYTITCNYKNVASGPFLHPNEDRSISHREAARFMSYPDRYEFVGAAIPRQIGNSVPPLLARAIGAHIIENLRDDLRPEQQYQVA
ncbi:DNA cytosine methyltransferase [Erythrobacter sp. A6_0]|uniref:DNA cytosine methyltransferase n=1 Tax=Erythrobacter sp. A6_0 TaxID=2821089 RepID=UPI001ADAB3B3|nr:DNA cytosine methyltransferase [Erythrobacter sp. A6_0]MBO9511684.1 DNA cytosine methyltransferase [Erythrobacter sp. A6_0]